jgi:hypothetical protein
LPVSTRPRLVLHILPDATEKAKKVAVKEREMSAARETNAAEAHKLEDTEFEEILVSLLGLSSAATRRFLEDPPRFVNGPRLMTELHHQLVARSGDTIAQELAVDHVITDELWSHMMEQDPQWERWALVSTRLSSQEASTRQRHVLALLRTLPQIDIRLYIGERLRMRYSDTKRNARVTKARK